MQVKLEQPIGLLGGTFDPIHLGHLHLAQTLYEALTLKEIRFIPCYQPLLREPNIATAEQRLKMVELAIKDFPYFSVDNREILRKGPSYTYDTLVSIRHELPKTPLIFIMGIDQFLHLDQWHRWQELLNLCHLVIANRPNYNFKSNPAISNLLNQHLTQDNNLLHQTLNGYIVLHTIPPSPISATNIRQALQQNQPIENLLPKAVFNFIKTEHLYQTD